MQRSITKSHREIKMEFKNNSSKLKKIGKQEQNGKQR